MMTSVFRIAATILFMGLLAIVPVLGEEISVELYPVYPSGGSGAPRVMSGGGTAVLDVITVDPGPAPLGGVTPPRPLTPTATITFTGMTRTPSIDTDVVGFTYKPPDTHHAVGPGAGAAGRIVHVTNKGIQIYDKSAASTSVAGPLDLDLFLTGLGAAGLSAAGVANLAFDPKVIYDQHSGRFFVVILDGKTPGGGGRSNVHICTSKTSTPGTVAAADWTVETASALTTFGPGPDDTWFDYPCIGADATRLIVTGNMFTAAGASVGIKIRAYLKSTLTDDGAPAGVTSNDINLTGAGSTVQPAHVFGATLNSDFYLVNSAGPGALGVWQLTGVPGAATLVTGGPGFFALTMGAFIAAGAPQISDGLNTLPTLDTVNSRLINAVYRNDAGNTDSIWLVQSADTDADGQTEVVWFEIDPNTLNSAVAGVSTIGALAVNQTGVINGSTAADWTFMPSISVNGSGDAVITYSESNAAKAADMRVVARFVSGAAGTFQAPVVIAAGAGEYDDFLAEDPERWGDYSAVAIDPDDDETFWVSNQVCETAPTAAGSDAVWGTRSARLGAVVVPVELLNFSVD